VQPKKIEFSQQSIKISKQKFTSLCSRLRNDLYCVEWGVKLYSLTHSPVYVVML